MTVTKTMESQSKNKGGTTVVISLNSDIPVLLDYSREYPGKYCTLLIFSSLYLAQSKAQQMLYLNLSHIILCSLFLKKRCCYLMSMAKVAYKFYFTYRMLYGKNKITGTHKILACSFLTVIYQFSCWRN